MFKVVTNLCIVLKFRLYDNLPIFLSACSVKLMTISSALMVSPFISKSYTDVRLLPVTAIDGLIWECCN